MTILNDYIWVEACEMKSVAISIFKTNALRIINQIATTGERVTVTKRGKPVVQVIPYIDRETKLVPGKLSNTILFEKDIISPLDEELWDACK